MAREPYEKINMALNSLLVIHQLPYVFMLCCYGDLYIMSLLIIFAKIRKNRSNGVSAVLIK